jgi:hypothetical protein
MKPSIRIGVVALFATIPASPAHGTEAEIKEAINRGVGYLKTLQAGDGTWPHAEIGATALAGLTLLECGVPPRDASVQQAARAVRRAAVRLTHTYSLSLSIMFLDLLGDAQDVPLIESMAVRLLDGQNGHGGWTYQCPRVERSEVRRLTTRRTDEDDDDPPPVAIPPRERKLPQEIEGQLKRILVAAPRKGTITDNSNTQFAILGLWVARRHGIPVGKALARVDARFRDGPNRDGGWGYRSPPSAEAGLSTPAMTCAGLLGLAVNHGLVHEAAYRTELAKASKDPKRRREPPPPDLFRDPAIRRGMAWLSSVVGAPGQRKNRAELDVTSDPNYYFLWSLERVAVAYGIKTFDNKDWYAWGSELLLDSQEQDGSWQGKYADAGADTCFALLFLRRANLAHDLSTVLQGKQAEPEVVSMKSRGAPAQSKPAPAEKPKAASPAKPAPDDAGDLKLPEVPFEPAPKSVPAPAPAEDTVGQEIRSRADQLVEAAPDRLEGLLNQLKDAKGGIHTLVLAQAIPQLKGPAKTKARHSLAERLSRMTAQTLRDLLKESDKEIRRAAALACAMKDDRTHVPDLIQLLAQGDSSVIPAARAALKHLTTQDFGPAAGADASARTEAVTRWKAWWKQQEAK